MPISIKHIRYVAIILIVIGLIAYVVAATALIHRELRTYELRRFITIKPRSTSYIVLRLMPNDSISISISCNGSVDVMLINKTSFEYLTMGLSYKPLKYLRNISSIEFKIYIPLGGTYYLVINNSLNLYYTQAHIYVRIHRYVLTEASGSLVSVSGTISLILGFSLLLYTIMKGISKEIMYEIRLDNIYCKSLSLSRHRCIVTVPYPYEFIMTRVINAYEGLGYTLWRRISLNLAVLKKKRLRLIPKTFSEKSRMVIVSVRPVINGSTLTFDYEVSSWSASGALDLNEIAKEVSYIVSQIAK